MDEKEIICQQIRESISVKESILADLNLIALVEDAAKMVIEVYKNGGKTMIAGNGGSAADAQHIAGEFVSRFYFDRPGLPAIALTTDTSILTAIGNDYGYERLFERQIQALANKGDVFIGISTSGNSENVIRAIAECKKKDVFVIGLVGASGGKMDGVCDICIKVPSQETPRIQESHILIGHIICCIVEEKLFADLRE